jgi:hypothetical protein
MKTGLVIAALILATAVLFVSFSSAMATDYFPLLNVSNQNVVWTVDPMKFFSPKDVDVSTIVVHYWLAGDPDTPLTLVPYKISIADSQIKLWFNAEDMPQSAIKNTVEGTLTTGETFVATGAGWTWTNIH